jgi:hypothetical protein
MFLDVARMAFGRGTRIVAAPEVRVLRVDGASGPAKKIGKVDFLIAKLDDHDRPVDFAALEVQAVYFSGEEIKSAVKEFLRTGQLPEDAYRRPDWRSSIQKRLMPQLSLKVPIFRRWGKKFFVATDSVFFGNIPSFRKVESFPNSEITWLVYPFAASGNGAYVMGDPEPRFSLWDDVATALREGVAPDPSEVLAEIATKQRRAGLTILTV